MSRLFIIALTSGAVLGFATIAPDAATARGLGGSARAFGGGILLHGTGGTVPGRAFQPGGGVAILGTGLSGLLVPAFPDLRGRGNLGGSFGVATPHCAACRFVR